MCWGGNLGCCVGERYVASSVADPDPGSGAFLTLGPGHLLYCCFWIRDPRSGMGKNQDPGSGINIPDPQHWWRDVVCWDILRQALSTSNKKSQI